MMILIFIIIFIIIDKSLDEEFQLLVENIQASIPFEIFDPTETVIATSVI